MISLPLAFAAALAAVQAKPLPPFEYGQSDVAFKESPPHSDADEVKARFRAKGTPGPWDVSKEQFRIWIPRTYKHADKWGLFIYVSAGDGPSLPRAYLPIFEKRKLLAVSAHKSGNRRNIFDRFRLAVDANFNMQKRFNIDPDRIYISGFSGGGRVASMMAVAYADLFSGGIPLCGVNFYKPIPGDAGKYWPPGYIPVKEALKIAKAKGRFVLVTGEKDFNLENTRSVYRYGFRRHNFKHAMLLEVPGMKHATPSAEWMDKGLEFLDNPK